MSDQKGGNAISRPALTPPLKWHIDGGKNYLAARIVALMPPHTHYVEPYAGGLSVLLAKDPEGVSEVVNDLNRDLINFWNVLANEEKFQAMRRLLEATPFSEWHWLQAAMRQENEITKQVSYDWSNAADFFVFCRQSLAGRMKAFAPLSRTRIRRGMNEQASAWLNCVDGLPAVHARLKRVVILCRPALDVIHQQDGEQTLFYLDPPYLHETRATTDDYRHEMTVEQHRSLLQLLAGIKGRFLLSGYPSALYQRFEADHGWTRHDFDLANHASGAAEKRRMTECLWTNY